MNVLITGAGISGLSAARLLQEKGIDPTVCEFKSKQGGLIECDVVDGFLYHKVGGHVFNSKNDRVLNWFWSHFDREREFTKVKRNAQILIRGSYVNYPIENNLKQLDKKISTQILLDLLNVQHNTEKPRNFKDFLLSTFGATLCSIYFFPYNEKIWQCDLEQVSLDWLEGKLPSPDLLSILVDNIYSEDECAMPHSTFYYPIKGGSQFIANRLSQGVTIEFDKEVTRIEVVDDGVLVNGQHYDKIIYTGDIRSLSKVIHKAPEHIHKPLVKVENLMSHSTSNILCECDQCDLSWLYLPESSTKAHRIIYTGSFASSNNGDSSRSSCTVEFSGELSEIEMKEEIKKLPGNLKPIMTNYQVSSYVIHDASTRSVVTETKKALAKSHIHLLGRFAEWEYFNMDTAIASAMQLVDEEFKMPTN